MLGDLLNFVDYRTGRGIAAEVYGPEYAREFIRNRRTGDWPANRRLWRRVQEGRESDLAERIRAEVRRQYRAARRALLPAEQAYVIYGNVDWPEEMATALAPLGLTVYSITRPQDYTRAVAGLLDAVEGREQAGPGDPP